LGIQKFPPKQHSAPGRIRTSDLRIRMGVGVPPSCKPLACSFPQAVLALRAAGTRGKGAFRVGLRGLEPNRMLGVKSCAPATSPSPREAPRCPACKTGELRLRTRLTADQCFEMLAAAAAAAEPRSAVARAPPTTTEVVWDEVYHSAARHHQWAGICRRKLCSGPPNGSIFGHFSAHPGVNASSRPPRRAPMAGYRRRIAGAGSRTRVGCLEPST
jgi:hypothetical protein